MNQLNLFIRPFCYDSGIIDVKNLIVKKVESEPISKPHIPLAEFEENHKAYMASVNKISVKSEAICIETAEYFEALQLEVKVLRRYRNEASKNNILLKVNFKLILDKYKTLPKYVAISRFNEHLHQIELDMQNKESLKKTKKIAYKSWE